MQAAAVREPGGRSTLPLHDIADARCDHAEMRIIPCHLRTFWSVVESAVGPLLLWSDGKTLTGLDWHPDFSELPVDSESGRDLDVLKHAAAELDEYFAGKRHTFDVQISPWGTEFQKSVWTRMQSIPFGETLAYGDVAGAIGKPAAARAVGTAVGINPICIIIPDHRVVSSTGALSGSTIGMTYRRRLLDLERSFLQPRKKRR
jgi:methylated-DNA-[protein]-cysteine S-methyltransferase